MIYFLAPALFFLWVVLSSLLLLNRGKNTVKEKITLSHYFGYAHVSSQAKDIGWNISAKEFWAIIAIAVSLGCLLAVFFNNPLIVVAGLVTGYYLPRFIVQRYKKSTRMGLMEAIPDFGRILIARLVDHHSIVKAFEIAQADLTSPIKPIIQDFIKDVGVGIGVQPALETVKSKVGYRKFNTFAETLLIAHQEGYSNEALHALEKAVEAIESDVKAIEALQIATRKKKRELLYVVAAAWMFPIVLSFLNTDNANIYLETLTGKILMFSYIVSTGLVLIKGEDYLSLRLEEL